MIQLTGCIRMTSPFSTQTGTAGGSSVKKKSPLLLFLIIEKIPNLFIHLLNIPL